MNKLFCGGFRSGTFLLDADLIQNECQGRDRSQESAENLSNKGVLAGQFTEALKLLDAHDRAFYEAALQLDDVLVLLGKFAYDTSRIDGFDCFASLSTVSVKFSVLMSIDLRITEKNGAFCSLSRAFPRPNGYLDYCRKVIFTILV